jgi:hypothetical protein
MGMREKIPHYLVVCIREQMSPRDLVEYQTNRFTAQKRPPSFGAEAISTSMSKRDQTKSPTLTTSSWLASYRLGQEFSICIHFPERNTDVFYNLQPELRVDIFSRGNTRKNKR